MFSPVDRKRLPQDAVSSDELEAAARRARATQLGAHDLSPAERFWEERYLHLQRNGYLLRPRYSPSWKPSWLGTALSPLSCEDSIIIFTHRQSWGIIDARQLRDGALVAIKTVEKHSGEIEIAQFLTSIHDSRNHCVPVLHVLADPIDLKRSLLVMPFLRDYNSPELGTIGDVIDFVDQTLEGLAFMHRHRVAHRDISVPNIMMDARPLYPKGYHPVQQDFTPDSLYPVTPLSRAHNPVRYYYIDFGLSTHFPPGTSPYVVGDIGRDRDVPELSDDVPYDAFKVDIYSLGNVYDQEFQQKYKNVGFLYSLIDMMKQEDPRKRPPPEDIIAHWQTAKAGQKGYYHYRLAAMSEQPIERMLNDTVAAFRNMLTGG
ncbi:kinase-like protein [Earliella scabrosa]|nr:kinase-like protein [Earliella scabrosa]